MAEPEALGDIEELTLCPRCRRPFDEAERPPKLLACQHHFCLACARAVLGRGRELYCAHCWKRTELPDGRAERLPTHRPVLALARRLRACLGAAPEPAPDAPCAAHALPALWCCACDTRACRACPPHAAHAAALRPPHEARALLARERRDLLADLARLAARQRDFQLRALDAATALKLRLEAELAAPPPPPGDTEPPASLGAAAAERDRLRARAAAAALRGRLHDAVRGAAGPLDAATLRRALAAPPRDEPPPAARADPLVFLGNYCTAELLARPRAERRDEGEADASASTPSPPTPGGAPSPRAFPLFYFELEVNGAPFGRIVVEVRSDVAPRMARNFTVLATGELGVGYRGCAVFQCWENESVITGDFEMNNGRGGRSAFEESFFMPDDTKLAAVRGAVGMRRSQKRHDQLGLVGSQFRIVLREMRGFSAIFASVVEGLELVDRLSRSGDSAGKPHSTILISSCGKLN